VGVRGRAESERLRKEAAFGDDGGDHGRFEVVLTSLFGEGGRSFWDTGSSMKEAVQFFYDFFAADIPGISVRQRPVAAGKYGKALNFTQLCSVWRLRKHNFGPDDAG